MEEQEIDLRDYLRVLKRKWKLIVGITVGCAVVSAVYSLVIPPVYEAIALIEPAKIQKTPVEGAATVELLFKNPMNPFLEKLAQQMDIKDEKAYLLSKRFNIIDKAGYLRISGIGASPEEAKKLVDIICSSIMERHSEMMNDVMKISNDEMNNIKDQLLSVKNNMEQLDKKLSQKEKTDILAQSYIFQALGVARENTLKRQMELIEKLRQKEMELKYYTKSAVVIADATLPSHRIAPRKREIVLRATIIGFIFSIFFVFVIDYFKKNPL